MAHNFNFDYTDHCTNKKKKGKNHRIKSKYGKRDEKTEKNEPNRNSEYDDHLIFVRIVIPAGERLNDAQTKIEKKHTHLDGTK